MAFRRRTKKKYGLTALPSVIIAEIMLYLHIDDILTLKYLLSHTELCKLVLYPLLSASNQGQFKLRFSEELTSVLSVSQLTEVRATPKKIFSFCSALRIKQNWKNIHTIKAIAASTDDGLNQDISKTLDGSSSTFWSSDRSSSQDKEDWLLFDLGEVVMVESIALDPYRARSHPGMPVYGFQHCWIELSFTGSSFYYQTEKFTVSNTDDMLFHVILDSSGASLSARFVKIHLKGCAQMCFNGFWYFAINAVQVWGIPVDCFPSPVPAILRAASAFD